MSRSFKSSPVAGNTTARSEKFDKRSANKINRCKIKHVLKHLSRIDIDELIFPVLRETSNVWNFAKDGKHWYKFDRSPWVRIKFMERLMRK